MPARLPDARIAVLFHPAYRRRDLRATAIYHLAEIWRKRGLEVVFAFGTRRPPEADLALVHVDLSVVPERYARLIPRYPIVLNGRILDIRKSTHSAHLVRRGDGYTGPVIAKTDLNAAGRPERLHPPRPLRELRRLAIRAGWRSHSAVRRLDAYRVFESSAEVPDALWRDPRFVVERFLPERSAGRYAARSCYVLGDARVCERSEGPSPIVCDETAERIENVAAHPEVAERCAALRLDYGKLDYTVRDGRCALLDVNKTVGASRSEQNARLQENRSRWADGLFDYLEGRRRPA
jgi:hypothetical protein